MYSSGKKLSEKKEKVMLDPSIFLSREIFLALKRDESIFVSHSFSKIDLKLLPEVLNYFSWYKRELKDKQLKEIKELIDTIKPYKANSTYAEEFRKITKGEILFKIKEIEDIIIDEYSFLRENSSLLLRTKKTISYFKRFGIATLDVGNSLIRKKRDLFQRFEIIRYGLRIYIAVLLLFNPPTWISIPNFILVFSDP